MRRHCQFTVKRSVVPPKCAVMSVGRSDSKHGHEETYNKCKENETYNRKYTYLFPIKLHPYPRPLCTAMQTHYGKFSHLFIAHAARFQEHNPMSTQCQFTVKRPEKRVDLTVAAEQQPKR